MVTLIKPINTKAYKRNINEATQVRNSMTSLFETLRNIPSLASRHYKDGNINWPMGIYISLVHVAAAVGLFTLLDCRKETLLWAFLLWPIR